MSFQMRFRMLKDTDILIRMHSNKFPFSRMEKYLVHQQINDEMVINAKIPESGDYSLELYIKEMHTDGTFPIVCSYLVTSGHGTVDSIPYPVVTNRKLGPTENNEALKLAPKSHPCSLIKGPESGELEITMTMPVSCDLMCEFDLYTEEKIEGKVNKL